MAERGVTDRVEVSQTNYALVPIVAALRIKSASKPVRAVTVAGCAMGLTTYAMGNWLNSEGAVKRALEKRDENGKLEAEAKNMKISSITVELHCYTKQSVLQFVKDFNENEVKRRLEEEFKKIGFDEELEVTLVNAEEVFQREEELRSLTDLEEGDKVTIGEVNVDPLKVMEGERKTPKDKDKKSKDKEKKLEEREKRLEEREKRFEDWKEGREKRLEEKEKRLEEREKRLEDVKEERERRFEEREKRLEAREKRFEEREKRLEDVKEEREKRFEERENRLEEREKKFVEREKRLEEREKRLEGERKRPKDKDKKSKDERETQEEEK